MSARLFLTLTPDDAATHQLLAMQRGLQARHAALGAGAVRWIAAQQFHLTLSFLGAPQGWCQRGDVLQGPSDPLLAIAAGAERVCSHSAPLKLEIAEQLVIFGEPQQAKAVVADVGQASQELTALQATLVQELEPLGFQPEAQPYRPHVTLARIKHSGSVEPWVHPASPRPTPPGAPPALTRFHAESVVLFDSVMTPGGGVYTELARFALGRGR